MNLRKHRTASKPRRLPAEARTLSLSSAMPGASPPASAPLPPPQVPEAPANALNTPREGSPASAPTAPPQVELRHLGGERRMVRVVGYFRNQLHVSWGGLAGLYYLDLATNTLVRARAWGAVDIKEARRILASLKEPVKFPLDKADIRSQDGHGWVWNKK